VSNLNEAGNDYQFIALGEERDDYGVLPPKASDAVTKLRDFIRGSPADPALIEATGVLDRLRSFNLQVARIHQHEEDLRNHMRQTVKEHGKDNIISAQAADQLSTDFESLLFHGRAVLDRLTLFIAREHKQNLDKFSKLERILLNASDKDPSPRKILKLLKDCPALQGTLLDAETETSLRSRVAHRSSISEGVQTHLTIHLFNGRALVIDCEAFDHGVISTSRALSGQVAYLVVNALRTYLRGTKPLAQSNFHVAKRFPVIVLKEWLDPNEKGPLLSVARIDKDGFTLVTNHVHAEIFRQARRP
jgi:hypothetical protein